MATELQKYYLRLGNRVVFKNGMTLNELAWEMWEKMGYSGVDPSVLSKVLGGERCFTLKQAEVFSQLLNLTKGEDRRIKEIIVRRNMNLLGVPEKFLDSSNENFIDLTNDGVGKVGQLRAKGLPHLAIEWIDTLLEKIEDSNLEILSKQRVQLLSQKIECHFDIEPKELLKSKVYKPLNDLGFFAGETKDIHLANWVSTKLADMYYLIGDHKKTVSLLTGTYDKTDNSTRLTALRLLALSYAYLGNKKEFGDIVLEVQRIAHGYSYQAQCEAYSCVGRGAAIFNMDTLSRNLLDKAWGIFNVMLDRPTDYLGLRRIQLIRSYADMAYRLNLKSEENFVKELLPEALQEARRWGYYRHERYILDLMMGIVS